MRHTAHLVEKRPRSVRLFFVAAAGLAVLLLAAGAAEACPMCKAALANSEDGERLVQGFFWSILFMLLMPFALLGSFSAYMYHLVRKARVGAEGALAASHEASAAEAGPMEDAPHETGPDDHAG